MDREPVNSRALDLIAAAAITAVLWKSFIGTDSAPTVPSRPTPDRPAPCPGPEPPKPQPRPRPWGPRFEDGRPLPAVAVGEIKLGGPVSPDQTTEVQVDLPVSERIKNIGSKVDGAGMCVMSSVEMAARWANLECLRGLRDWCAQQPGGAYPGKVDKQLKEYAEKNGCSLPDYIQYEGADPSLIEAALKAGRAVGVTYGGSDGVRYKGPIAHMVVAVCYDDRWVCLLDNNGIGENELLWMSKEDFLKRWKSNGGGWAFVWLSPPPPPAPHQHD